MAKCILISYAGYPYTLSSLLLDNGLANLAGGLLEAGHRVKILDFGTVSTIKRLIPEGHKEKLNDLFKKYKENIYKDGLKELANLNKDLEEYQNEKVHEIGRETAQFIEKEKADFAGVKLWNGDGFTGSITIAEEIKKRLPGFPVAAGGPHVDMYREYILDATDKFDVLAYGEGEQIIVDLANYYEGRGRLEKINNLIYRKNGQIKTTEKKWIEDLNTLPFPVYDEDIYLAMKGDEKIKIIVLDESRGCSNCCNFCMQPIKSGTRIRMKSPDRLIEEIKKIKKRYKINCFRFAGSATPSKLIKKVAQQVIDEGIDIKYTMFARIKGSDEDLFKTLKKSGCQAIFFGVESGSQKILDKSIGKKIKKEEIREVIKACKRSGIFTVTSFIIPAPFETEETIKESLDLILEVHTDSVMASPPGIMMETKWDKNYKKFGFEFPKGKDYYFKNAIYYKYKLLFPMQLWESVPYKVNNLSFFDFIGKTGYFLNKLEKENFLTSFPDELSIVAKYSNYNEKEFRDKCRILHLSGNHIEIFKIITRVNKKIISGKSN